MHSNDNNAHSASATAYLISPHTITIVTPYPCAVCAPPISPPAHRERPTLICALSIIGLSLYLTLSIWCQPALRQRMVSRISTAGGTRRWYYVGSGKWWMWKSQSTYIALSLVGHAVHIHTTTTTTEQCNANTWNAYKTNIEMENGFLYLFLNNQSQSPSPPTKQTDSIPFPFKYYANTTTQWL